jgi:uncharacterized membrane protein
MQNAALILSLSLATATGSLQFESAAVVPDPAAPDAADARRNQLTIHQTMGLTTLGGLAVTGILGSTFNFQRQSGAPASVTGPIGTAHLAGSALTGLCYLTTATLALTAPQAPVASPYEGVDSVLVHKGLALLHGAGILSTISLGLLSARQDPALLPYHQVLGLTTLALLSASAAVIAIDF